MTTETLERQIYALEIKLLKGSNGSQNLPLIQKINNLKKKLKEMRSETAWQNYLSK
jgi:hypothetical protein